MKKIISIIISFFASYISIIVLGKTIPAGYEMGGIAIGFIALLFSFLTFILITIIYVAKSISINEKTKNYKHEIIYIITSVIVSATVYSLSIYSQVGKETTPLEDFEAHKKFEQNLIETGKANISIIRLKLKNSENCYFDSIYLKDSTLIHDYFKIYFDSMKITTKKNQDVEYHHSVGHFFDLDFVGNDSLETVRYRKKLLENLKIEHIGYSLDRKFCFVIINMTDRYKRGVMTGLIGVRKNGFLKLYKYYGRYSCHSITSEFGLYSLVNNFGIYGASNPLYKEFWKDTTYFGIAKINNKHYYNFQTDLINGKRTTKYYADYDIPSIVIRMLIRTRPRLQRG